MISFSFMIKPVCTAVGLALLLSAVAAAAEIYKWIENGTVHYGNTPPAGHKAETVRPAAPPAARTEAAREALEARREQLQEQEHHEAELQQRAAVEAERRRVKQQNCDNARQALEQLQTHNRLQYTNEDGELAYLTEQQRNERMDKARERIRSNCS